MISTSRQSARGAAMPSIRKGLRHSLPAQARLTRSAWVHLHQHSPSAFCLVREKIDELGPPCITNGLRQHPASEALHVQIFDRDQSVLIDEISGQLVLEIRPLVADVNVRPLQLKNSLAPTVAALLPPRDFALYPPQFCLSVPIMPGIVDFAPVRERSKTLQANVNSDRPIRRWQGRRPSIYTKANKPSASLPFDGKRLDYPFYWSMDFQLEMSQTLQAQDSDFKQSVSVSRFRKCQTIVAAEGAVSRKSRLVPIFRTSKEVPKSSINSPQNISRTRKTYDSNQAFGPHRLQLLILIIETDGLPADFPSPNAFLESTVVKITRFPKLVFENGYLILSGVQPVFVRQAHVKQRRSYVQPSRGWQAQGWRSGSSRVWMLASRAGALPVGSCGCWFESLPYPNSTTTRVTCQVGG